MLERGLVGNPESSLVHRRSPKSINQSPKSKVLGLSLSTPVWFKYLIICLEKANEAPGIRPLAPGHLLDGEALRAEHPISMPEEDARHRKALHKL